MATVSERLLEHVSYLRRYARALTGSRSRGDEYVRVCLEAMMAEADADEIERNPRLELFHTFHDVWSRIAPPAVEGPGGGDDPDRRSLKRSLAALPQLERQVFLLHELERFTLSEVGLILGIGREDAENALDQARRDLASQPLGHILVIEDDPVIAMGHAQLIEEMGHGVAGIAGTEAEALALYRSQRPNLVLADIRLRGGDDGIHAVEEIMKIGPAPVIFVTGHPEDLLQGGPAEPTYVIEKPFDPEALKAVISQALSFSGNGGEPTRGSRASSTRDVEEQRRPN